MKYFVVSTLLMAVAVNGGLINLDGLLSGGGASTTGANVHTAVNSDGGSEGGTWSISNGGGGGKSTTGSVGSSLGDITSSVGGTLTGATDTVDNLTEGLGGTVGDLLGGNHGSGQYFRYLFR